MPLSPIKVLFLLFTLPVLSFGDGLARDENGNLKNPHHIIPLQPFQIEEIEALNSLTLTPEQWATARKLSPNTPKRLNGIETLDSIGCGCHGPRYDAIQLKNGKIAILVNKDEQTPESIAWRFKRSSPTFTCDRRGQFHIDGILVRFPILLEALALTTAKPVPPPEETRFPGWVDPNSISVTTPPGMPLDHPTYVERMRKVPTELQEPSVAGAAKP